MLNLFIIFNYLVTILSFHEELANINSVLEYFLRQLVANTNWFNTYILFIVYKF